MNNWFARRVSDHCAGGATHDRGTPVAGVAGVVVVDAAAVVVEVVVAPVVVVDFEEGTARPGPPEQAERARLIAVRAIAETKSRGSCAPRLELVVLTDCARAAESADTSVHPAAVDPFRPLDHVAGGRRAHPGAAGDPPSDPVFDFETMKALPRLTGPRLAGRGHPQAAHARARREGRMIDATGRAADTQGVSAEELAASLGTDDAPFLLDVREPDEFSAWSITGARNVPLSVLGHQLTQVDRDRQVVVVCASGQRSASAVDALKAAGIEAASLVGGMLAWAGVYDTATLELDAFEVVQIRRRAKGCLSYVVCSGGEALVVDPSSDIDRYLGIVAERGWEIRHVLDTHLHADHVSGARALAEATGAALHLSDADPLHFPFTPVSDGAHLTLGDSSVKILATPGHTLGSLVVDLGGAMLTGDTLFVDGVGRPDLADRAREYAEELHRSLGSLLDDQDDDVLVLPAHFGDGVAVVATVPVAASLGSVREAVPQLDWDGDRFVAWASTRAAPRPPSFVEIIRLNTGESKAGPDEVRALELGPNRCSA